MKNICGSFLILSLLLFLAACGRRESAESSYEVEAYPSTIYTPSYTEELEYVADTPVEPDEPEIEVIQWSVEEITQSEIDRLPSWLRVGLELYLLGEDLPDFDYGIHTDVPDFGDAWFVPGLVPEVQPEEATAVALAFIQYISAAGELNALVAQHLNNRQVEEAITSSANLWSDFANAPNKTGFYFRYERGRRQHVEGSPLSPFGIILSVRGNYARYFFGHEANDTPEQWTMDMVNHSVAIGEESIRFVSDWLGHEPNRRFSVYFIHIDGHGGGGGYGEGILTNFDNIADPPFAMAHEAVHAVLAAARIHNNFPQVSIPFTWGGVPGYMTIPFFEEGMCIMLELLFEIATENERFALEAAGRRRGYWLSSGEFGNQETRLSLDDALKYVNNRAIGALDYYYEPGNTERFGRRYTVLNMHYTAASFMFYLYTERGTRADLLRFYQNINLAYEIYGADMNGLIDDWQAWLDDWR